MKVVHNGRSSGGSIEVARIIVLDSGPLGLLTRTRNIAQANQCRGWLQALDAAGARVVVPEIADYEVRRELLRIRASGALARLDRLINTLNYASITTPAMRRAAEFWAIVRQAGRPTADAGALDGDCILASQASLLGGPNDQVTIATLNVGHLARFPGIEARIWDQITP